MKSLANVSRLMKLGLILAALSTVALSQTISSIILSPASTVGGVTTTLNTVTLTGAAPAGGAIVTLQSSSPSASAPASVTVPAGATSVKFTITTTWSLTVYPFGSSPPRILYRRKIHEHGCEIHGHSAATFSAI